VPTVALLVDHPQRDLLGLVLVAYKLCLSGVRCFLIPSSLAWQEICGLAPDLVVLSHLRQYDEKFVELMVELGSTVAVLDTEGGVLESLESYEKSLSTVGFVRESVRCYCAWGTRQRREAERRRWFPNAEILTTGPPRFDFYSAPWRTIVHRLDGSPQFSGDRMALVMGTFTLANSRFKSVQDEVTLLIEEAGLSASFVENRLRCEMEALHGMILMCKDLTEWEPDVNWVYRPHPFERRDTYDKNLPSSVSVRCDGSVQQWILGAEVLIQRGSTTAVEAALAGVPVLSADWLPDWAQVNSIRQVSVPCATLTEMKEALTTIRFRDGARNTGISLEGRQVIHDWFHECDGAAHERVANALLTVLPESESAVDRDRALHYFVGLNPAKNSLSKRIGGWLRVVGNLPADFSFSRFGRVRGEIPWDSGGRSFSVSEINRILDLIHETAEECGAGSIVLPQAVRADRGGFYLRPYSLGRAVVIEPARKEGGNLG